MYSMSVVFVLPDLDKIYLLFNIQTSSSNVSGIVHIPLFVAGGSKRISIRKQIKAE